MKRTLINLSEIAAVAVMIGAVASDNPFVPLRMVSFISSLSWIALLLTANRKGR